MSDSTVNTKLEVGGSELRVLSYRIRQELCAVDKVELIVDASTDFTLDSAESYLRKPAKLELTSFAVEAPGYFHGTVVAARYATDVDDVQRLELEVEGPLYALSRTANSKLYQKTTLEKIVESVLTSARETTTISYDGPSDDVNYVVQYDETNLDFLNRTLAEDGVAWFARHGSRSAEVFFVDKVNEFTEEPRVLEFRSEIGTSNIGDYVSHARMTHRTLPDRVRVAGYDPHRPSLTIEEEAESTFDGTHTNEIYAPETRRPSPEAAEREATTLTESYDARRTQITLITSALGLQPGDRISLEDHPYPPMNGEFLVASVEQEGARARQGAGAEATTAETRRVEVVATPAAKPWRPARMPVARRIMGPQTAITTGDGEEIYTNEHGEVTAKFHWDRDGKPDHTSSRFMRTSQLPTGGSMLLPRVGWEVLVDFQEGDVDQPMVMSRLYNGGTMPPYTLPENALKSSIQTATSPGGGTSNEVRMSDTKGDEQMMFNASRDMSTDVGNNATHSIGNDLKVDVGVDQSLTVIDSVKWTVGTDQSTTISGNQSVTVGTMAVDDVTADHSSTVGGNRIQMVGGDHRRTVEGASELTVATSSLTAVIGSVSLDTAAGHDHKVGAALIELAAGSRSVVVAGARTETTGGAKVLVVKGGRAVEAGTMATQVAGAVVSEVSGDRGDKSKASWCETAGGQQKIEAKNITLEGEYTVALTMGGASVILTPISITIAGSKVELDGKLVQTSPLNLNN